jgi:hypothetical protein
MILDALDQTSGLALIDVDAACARVQTRDDNNSQPRVLEPPGQGVVGRKTKVH